MEPERPRRRTWRWVLCGAVLLVVFMVYTFREPGIPFQFLNGKEILHSQIDLRINERTLIVQGSKDALAKAAERELGAPFFSTPEETQFKFGRSFLSITRPRPVIASINPLTNKAVEAPRNEKDETIKVSYPIEPGALARFRAWVGSLFSRAPVQKGANAGTTGP